MKRGRERRGRRAKWIRRAMWALLVLLSAAFLVVSTTFQVRAVWLNTASHSFGVSLGSGAVGWYWIDRPVAPRSQRLFTTSRDVLKGQLYWLPRYSRGRGYRQFMLPSWCCITLAAGILYISIRYRRTTSDACPNCRYPLRGLKPAALGVHVCPECGSPIEALPSENERGAGTFTPTVFADRVEREKLVIGPHVAGKSDERTDYAGSAEHPPTRGTEQRDPPNRHTAPDKSGQPGQ